MKKLIYAIPVLIFLVALAFFSERLESVANSDDPKILKSVLLNKPVPDFALPALPGRGRPLASTDLKGDVTLLNVFGSWCVACVAEHPVLKRIADEGYVKIHAIDWRDDPEKGAAWLRRNGDPYDLVGGGDDTRWLAIDLGVTGAPETFVIDQQGIIRYKHTGIITDAVWADTLKPMIANLRAGKAIEG
jgi:cytochrome c biogenesis protein CcmG/thiol:disulfide interchange protein DsbE